MFEITILLIGLVWLMVQGVLLLAGGAIIMCLGLGAITGFFMLIGHVLGLDCKE